MKKASELLSSCEKFHITLGLDRIKKILELLDNPQEKYKVIHVAGTNGKGSTCKIINEILIQKFKTGLFTSPHLFSYTERIKINNENISEYIFDKLTNEINDLALKNDIELSEFELICAVAFYYFYLKQVEYVVLEVGLGGAFDATNIISKPLLEIITTIDFDHTERLGKTIDEIAKQKAGIIKKNSKVIIDKENLGYKTIEKIAKEKKAKIIFPQEIKIQYKNNQNFALYNNEKLKFNLLGSHQAKNLSLALCAIENLQLNFNKDEIKKALKKVRWSARLEFFKEKNLLIDGAHNPSGAIVLKDFLNNFKKKKTYFFGCLKNKDYKKILEILLDEKDELYIFEFNYPNALKYNDLDDITKKRAKKISSKDELKKAIEKTKGLKVVTGSFYMIGQLKEILY